MSCMLDEKGYKYCKYRQLHNGCPVSCGYNHITTLKYKVYMPDKKAVFHGVNSMEECKSFCTTYRDNPIILKVYDNDVLIDKGNANDFFNL